MLKEITIAHSSDADDAFMFYSLSSNKVPSQNIIIHHHITEIEELNREAFTERYEITAISFHSFSKVMDKYDLMPCGASFGLKYGPIVVARDPLTPDQLKNILIAVPGCGTSAFLLLSHYLGDFTYEIAAFDTILPNIINGKYQAGLIIHEGQITYTDYNLHKVLDLGALWFNDTNLPLPLGGLAIRKNLASEDKKFLIQLIKESLAYSLNNFDEAFLYASKYSRNAPADTIKKFINMYVNDLTMDYGEQGIQALKMFSHKFQLPDISQSLITL